MARNQSGVVLKSCKDVSAGEHVSVTLGEGGFSCVVDKVYEKERKR